MSDDTTSAPIREALEQVERMLRWRRTPDHTWIGAKTADECADVIHRLLDDYYVIDRRVSPDAQVVVPVAELEALRCMVDDLGYGGHLWQRKPVFDALIARIPEPEWVPTESQIDAYIRVIAAEPTDPTTRAIALRRLRQMHAEGLIREDTDHE